MADPVVVHVLADYAGGLCVLCLAAFVQIPVAQLENEIAHIGKELGVHAVIGRCSVCTAEGTVYRLE